MGRRGVSVVILWMFSAVTYGIHIAPFIDPDCIANRDCSWSWLTPTQNGIQFCERDSPDAFDICPDSFLPPDDFDSNDRPQPAKRIILEDMNKNFISESGEVEQYTCVRITIIINEYGAENVKGIQIAVQGKEAPDLSLLYCMDLNFSTGLGFNSVKGHPNITCECFCGMKPGREYEVAVRTMPLDTNDGNHDTTVSEDFYPAVCLSASKTKDVRCQKNAEALWEPDCIQVQQNYSTGHYNNVAISFNVAPPDYKFDSYQIFVFPFSSSGTGRPSGGPLIVDMSTASTVYKTCPQSEESMVFVTKLTDVSMWHSTDGQLSIRLQPKPSNNLCKDAENQASSCARSLSLPFLILTDPCNGNPCGANGTCSSNRDEYSCDCHAGFAVFDETCKVDPCLNRCENGACIYTNQGLDFYCMCNENFLYMGKECVANPCAINPGTNTTVCGEHGSCVLNTTTDVVIRHCQCDAGYINKKDQECKVEDRSALIIGVTVGSCMFGLVLSVFVIIVACRIWIPPLEPPEPPEVPPAPDITVLPPQNVKRKHVLPIFSDDHPLHHEVVLTFCRFLKKHCQCDVSLVDWEEPNPSVGMWLTHQIEEADIVLLICSKGCELKYKAKAKQEKTDSDGVYGDVFVKALFLLEEYCSRVDAGCNKFVVAYFDYSSENDIPVPFRRFGKYNLMKSMEELYLRIHRQIKDSPTSSRRAAALHEDNYPKLEMGKWLHKAIQAMKALVKTDRKWYSKQNSKPKSNGKVAIPGSEQLSPYGIDPNHHSFVDSAYTSDLSEPRAPSFIFNCKDKSSTGQGSDCSDFEESMKDIQNNTSFSEASCPRNNGYKSPRSVTWSVP